jgi:hypothetical protein
MRIRDGKNSDPRSGIRDGKMRIRDPGWKKIRIRDPGWKKLGSGLWDKHPGSATLFMFIFFLFCVEAADRPLAIQIITDKAFKTLTIQDNGIGMSKVGILGFFVLCHHPALGRCVRCMVSDKVV